MSLYLAIESSVIGSLTAILSLFIIGPYWLLHGGGGDVIGLHGIHLGSQLDPGATNPSGLCHNVICSMEFRSDGPGLRVLERAHVAPASLSHCHE